MPQRIRRYPRRRPNPLAALQQGTYGTGGEVLGSWSFYDTLVLLNTTTIYRMFTIPIGGAAGRTLDQTNMTQGGQIAQGQNLTVKRLKMQYISSAARNTAAVQLIYNVLNRTTLEIMIPGKDALGQWTLAELFGIASLIAMTPTAAGDNIPLIQPTFKGIFTLEIPLVLAALTPFELRVTPQIATDAALNGDFIRVALNGTLRRSA
jgi:hypothetical protein